MAVILMLYMHPNDNPGGGDAGQGNNSPDATQPPAALPPHRSRPSTTDQIISDLRRENTELTKGQKASLALIKDLRDQLAAVVKSWEQDRRDANAEIQKLGDRARDAERALRTQSGSSLLKERVAQLEGLESAIFEISKACLELAKKLGVGQPNKAFEGKTATELQMFVLEVLAIIAERAETLKESKDRAQQSARELRDTNKSLEEQAGQREQQVAQLEEDRAALIVKMAELSQRAEQVEPLNRQVEALNLKIEESRAVISEMDQDQLTNYFAGLNSNNQQTESLLRAIRLSSDAPATFNAALRAFDTTIESRGNESEEFFESDEYRLIERAKINCEEIVAKYSNRFKSLDLLLELELDLTYGIVNKLDDPLLKQYISLHLVDTDRPPIVATSRIREVLEQLPVETHAALVSLSRDTESKLEMLFGTPTVAMAAKLLQEKVPASQLDFDNPQQTQTVIREALSKLKDHEREVCEAASNILSAIFILDTEIAEQLEREFLSTREAVERSTGPLGFPLPYAWALIPES